MLDPKTRGEETEVRPLKFRWQQTDVSSNQKVPEVAHHTSQNFYELPVQQVWASINEPILLRPPESDAELCSAKFVPASVDIVPHLPFSAPDPHRPSRLFQVSFEYVYATTARMLRLAVSYCIGITTLIMAWYALALLGR